MEKTLKTRIKLKNDTPENWEKAENFIPLKGEPLVWGNYLKIGDGVNLVKDLPILGTEDGQPIKTLPLEINGKLYKLLVTEA